MDRPGLASVRNPSAESGYGGFALGGMQLALPMSALREVLPCITLIPLPSAAPCVVGGIDLRGVLVPVVDLRIVLGRPTPPCAMPCVVLMVHAGSILGLLCEEVTGVFSSLGGRLSRSTSTDPMAALLAGSIQRADEGTLVNVLSTEALARLPQVPMVADPEPGRQLTLTDTSTVVINAPSVPVMLFRCGRVPLAIDAMAVHATLSEPRVRHSVLASGHCLGVLDYAGQQLPVVDVLALCGLGQQQGPVVGVAAHHAFVVRMPTGLLAFLVDKVLDVVPTLPSDVMQIPPFALPHPALFAGGLALSALPPEVKQQFPVAVSQFLMIDGAALKADAQMLELARMGLGEATPGGRALVSGRPEMRDIPGQEPRPTGRQRSMITYQLGMETASPIEQVTEILPYTGDVSVFDVRGALLGLVAHRGRSIPVMCLSRLVGLPAPEMSPAVSVLVVEVDGTPMGFAVPALLSIELADWEPELPRMGANDPDDLTRAVQSRQLAQVRGGGTQRMLRLLDLHRMARALQQQPRTLLADVVSTTSDAESEDLVTH